MLAVALLPISLLVVPAYLLGTFPSAILVARAGGHDVLAEGSRNPGASNVTRLLGWKAGILVLVADVAKGTIAAGIGLAAAGPVGALALGLAAVAGHVFPMTRRFKGGKGVATASGALVVLFPWIVAGLAIVWFLVARVLHRASIASLLCTVAFPILAWLTGHGRTEVVVVAVLAIVIVARHGANLRRLARGDEPTLPPGERDAT
ncbi:MAG TPA: glycerol-3-phosphate 1-O-acyltransferase PlsY [Acidimicrobiia bacterium]|nr:glycerol-3-phosphate 1-O-acyltransferase PlsY [Acidimicrobiia bacterium]